MIDKFRLGVKELIPIWTTFMPDEITNFLHRAQNFKKEEFRITDEIWAEIIYRFALAAHAKVMNKEHLLKSLTPLYIGRTASFVMDAWESSADEVESKIEKLCKTFEDKKTLLTENWG